MLLAVFCVPSADADGESLWVNGVDVINHPESMPAGCTYDPGSNTLTLNGANLTTSHVAPFLTQGTLGAVIFDDRDTALVLNVVGNSNVINNSASGEENGIQVAGNLTITGSGSLSVSASNGVCGIFTVGSLTFNGPTVTIAAGSLPVCGNNGIVISAGTVNSSLDSNNGITISGSSTVNSGGIEATSGIISIEGSAAVESSVITTGTGGLSVSGSVTVNVTNMNIGEAPSANSNFSMSGGTINVAANGYIDVNGNITMSGGSIVFAGGHPGVSLGAYGTPESDGTVTLTGGSITVNNAAAGIIFIAASDNSPPSATPILTYEGANPLNNLAFDDNQLTVIQAGSASISFPAVSHTISFNANGGTGTMANVENTTGSYTLPANGFTAPANKAFKCWSVGGVEKNVGDVITVTQNVEVTAVWQDSSSPAPAQTFTVTFDANGGTGEMAPVADVSGEYTLPANGFTAPAEKTFKCWSVGDAQFKVGEKINVAANVTVKAVWKDVPAPEPAYASDTVDGKAVYKNEIAAATDTDVSGIFTAAKGANGAVDVKIGTMDISFDSAAVSAIGGNTVSLKAEMKTEGLTVPDAKAVIEVTLDGALFANGTAKVTVPFTQEVPEGKELVVYFINGDTKEKMDATYENGKVVFTTNHFSTYAIVFEDESDDTLMWIEVGIVAALAVIAISVLLYLQFRRKA
ncbi:hypothetical protein TALC_01162 [Thermoplasmatales archaeon BRNA1]|nr:hypothetical protein TALC_01162 [Thermoplasmatales archaeon BRNA1]